MSAPAELQQAVFQALSADPGVSALVGGRIHDQAPRQLQFPYITFGSTSIYDWSTGTESGTEQLFTLHVWSKTPGKKETLAIMDAVRACLEHTPLSLASRTLVDIALEFAEARHDEDLEVNHGLLRYRAISE